jgi:ketosteroid isomerase-like protein
MLPSNASDWEGQNPAPQRRGPRFGAGLTGLLVALGLMVVLVAVIAFAVTRLPTGPAPKPAVVATAAPAGRAPAGGTIADAATQQAIQDVIRRLDNAQAQAIATGDQQVMAATATPEFYQLQVATNQDLVANGVTEVQLMNMEWGDITVNGEFATATVYETWSTTFDDGTTEQARDRNVYTLIKDPNKGWIVQADDHPDQPTNLHGAPPTPRPTN